jgi:hypothetical protein
MENNKESPLVKALPPETDYLTYLTILEYNLDKEQLPLLHKLLQDTTLTTNIGWDLVHILLPFLPESEQCLQDIAFLGNPRETVLKVAELLEEFSQATNSQDSDDEIDEEEEEEEEEGREPSRPDGTEKSMEQDMLALQFQSLLHMLCILHPRIQTKRPSRFLATSLQAVIKAFKTLAQTSNQKHTPSRIPSAMGSILMLLKSLSGSKRPHFPPRRSQSAIPTVIERETAPDPEGQKTVSTPEEQEIKQKILQSFVTHVFEIYLQSIPPIDLDSPVVWTSRYHELRKPVPNKIKLAKFHKIEEELERIDATISQLLVGCSTFIRCG